MVDAKVHENSPEIVTANVATVVRYHYLRYVMGTRACEAPLGRGRGVSYVPAAITLRERREYVL